MSAPSADPLRPLWRHWFVWVLGAAALLVVLVLQGASFGPVNWLIGKPYQRAMGPGAALVGIVLAAAWGLRFLRSSAPTWARLTAIVLIGAGVQLGYVLAESRGKQGLASVLRAENAHSEFVDIACDQDLTGLVSRYDAIAVQRGWVFPRSKPPGCLMTYRALVRVAQTPIGPVLAKALLPDPPNASHHTMLRWRTGGVTLALLPLLTFLTAVPLFFLTRRIAGDDSAAVAVTLFTFAPAVGIIPMYLDGAVYPLIITTAAALAIEGTFRDSVAWLFVAGMVASLGLFVSFSILPAAAVVLAWPCVHAWAVPLAPGFNRWTPARQTGALIAGLVAFHAWPFALGYRPVARYLDAMEYHRTWWSGGGRNWVLGSSAQFAIWIGLPVAAAFLAQSLKLATRERAARAGAVLFASLCVLLLIGTALFSHARIEAMRLWLFWIPFVCAAAAPGVVAWEQASGKRLVGAIVLTQVATALALKQAFAFF